MSPRRASSTLASLLLVTVSGTIGQLALLSAGLIRLLMPGGRLGPLTVHKVLLFVLVLGLGISKRSFSYSFDWNLHIGPVPVFLPELLMVMMLCVCLGRGLVSGRLGLRTTPLNLLIAAYLGYGAIHCLTGFPQYGIWAVRDFAVVYYALFYFLLVNAIQTREDLRQLAIVLFVAFAVGFSLESIMYPLLGIICALVVVYWPDLRSRWVWAGVIVAILISWFVDYIPRSPLMGVLAVVAAARWWGRGFPDTRHVRVFVRFSVCAGCVAVLYLVSNSQDELVANITRNAGREFGRYEIGDQVVFGGWRQIVWQRYAELAMQKPLFGWGLGYYPPVEQVNPNVFQTKILIHPHNSFVTVLFKMGLLGFLLMVAIQVAFYRQSLAFLREDAATDIRRPMIVVLSAHAFMFIFASFNVVLENSYYGIWFWLILGCSSVLLEISNKQESSVTAPVATQDSL